MSARFGNELEAHLAQVRVLVDHRRRLLGVRLHGEAECRAARRRAHKVARVLQAFEIVKMELYQRISVKTFANQRERKHLLLDIARLLAGARPGQQAVAGGCLAGLRLGEGALLALEVGEDGRLLELVPQLARLLAQRRARRLGHRVQRRCSICSMRFTHFIQSRYTAVIG